MHDLQEKSGIEDDVAILNVIAYMTDKQKLNYDFHLSNDMNFTTVLTFLKQAKIMLNRTKKVLTIKTKKPYN